MKTLAFPMNTKTSCWKKTQGNARTRSVNILDQVNDALGFPGIRQRTITRKEMPNGWSVSEVERTVNPGIIADMLKGRTRGYR